MYRKELRKNYRALEKHLLHKYRKRNESDIKLIEEDFKYGKLSHAGYKRLRDQCDYIDPREQVEIVMPEQYTENFKETIEEFTIDELSHVSKDMFYTRITALVLLVLGVAWLALWYFVQVGDFFRELSVIVSWVFVWSAMERWFFKLGELRNNKLNLLHLLAAKIKGVSE